MFHITESYFIQMLDLHKWKNELAYILDFYICFVFLYFHKSFKLFLNSFPLYFATLSSLFFILSRF